MVALKTLSPETWALLSFGEIDVRCHILKHGGNARACADHYLSFVRFARKTHARIALWAPIATQPASVVSDKDYPALATVVERNNATAQFTHELMASEIPAISIFDLMIDERGGTRPETLWDGHHASRDLLPEALQRITSRLGLERLAA
jgi:hypothetical protein